MSTHEISAPLEKLVAEHPIDSAMWDHAIEAAWSAPRERGDEEKPAEKLIRLRKAIEGELVAFHRALEVFPYTGDDLPCPEGARLIRVGVPLTLFPKRDRGFTRVECIVELSAGGDGDAPRVLQVLPKDRSEVVATAAMGASLDLDTNVKLGIPLPLPGGSAVSSAAAHVYGKAEAAFVYEARRIFTATEIVGGTGARWRLEDPSRPDRVGVESHQLMMVIAVKNGATALRAAGYLQAYSDTQWLTSSVGGFWQNLAASVRKFFQRGAPVEAYAEWEVTLPA
jgi:hypothetical protein